MAARAIELHSRGPVGSPGTPAFRVVTAVTFEPGGLSVDYVAAEDIKGNGVMLRRSLFIPHADQYDDEIDAVIEAAQQLLDDVLADFTTMPTKVLDDEDDDDSGMGE